MKAYQSRDEKAKTKLEVVSALLHESIGAVLPEGTDTTKWYPQVEDVRHGWDRIVSVKIYLGEDGLRSSRRHNYKQVRISYPMIPMDGETTKESVALRKKLRTRLRKLVAEVHEERIERAKAVIAAKAAREQREEQQTQRREEILDRMAEAGVNTEARYNEEGYSHLAWAIHQDQPSIKVSIPHDTDYAVAVVLELNAMQERLSKQFPKKSRVIS